MGKQCLKVHVDTLNKICLAVTEIVKIIEECRYNDELAEGYKREILDQEKVFD